MALSERQQTAQSLAHEIHQLGGWVTNAMPLDANGKLRFQVSDENREQVLEKLSSWNWAPVFVSALPRIDFSGMKPGSIYEIDLPRERQPIHDDRLIRGELAERKKTSEETAAVLKYLGLDKPRKYRT